MTTPSLLTTRGLLKTLLSAAVMITAIAWAQPRIARKWFYQADLGPRLLINQTVSSHILASGKTLLVVDLAVKNGGRRSFGPLSGRVEVQQISPLTAVTETYPQFPQALATPEKEGDSSLDRRVENSSRTLLPGEVDQLHYELLVSGSVCVVEVKSSFENPKGGAANSSASWQRVTTHSVRPREQCIPPPAASPVGAATRAQKNPAALTSSSKTNSIAPPASARNGEFVEDFPTKVEGL